MTVSEQYSPGPANIAHVEKDGDNWTLVLVRNLRHAPEKVWQAITDPAQLREWAPFDADRSLNAAGVKVKLTKLIRNFLPRGETFVYDSFEVPGIDVFWITQPSFRGRFVKPQKWLRSFRVTDLELVNRPG